MIEIRNIKYDSKDFDSLRTNLMDYIKQYYPTTFSDFTRNSALMAILDGVAYAGDVLNYYQDKRLNDLFISSDNREALFNLARNFGYVPHPPRPSFVIVNFTATFANPSLSSNLGFILQKGTQVLSNGNPSVIFELRDDLSFSSPSTADATYTITTDGELTISRTGIAIAGETKSQDFSVTLPEAFYKYEIDETDPISEVLSITSSDGNTWYEVPTLAQDYIIQGIRNSQSDSMSSVPYFLTLLYTERRYEVMRTPASGTVIQFGSSYITNENKVSIPNPEDFIVNNIYRGQQDNFIIKPSSIQTFLNTSSLGALPTNTTLTVMYRIGGGTSTNVPAGSIETIRNKKTQATNTTYVASNQRVYDRVIQSLEVINPNSAEGGDDEESNESISRNIRLQQYAQQRLISEQDYEFFTKQLPPVYGTVFRSKAKFNNATGKIELALLSKNREGQLQIPHYYLKDNVVKYFNIIKPLDDNISIMDGNIINIGVTYTLNIDKTFNQSQIIVNTINIVKNFLSINNFDMGEPISKSELLQLIQQLDGVLSIGNLVIFNISGTVNGRSYSTNSYNVELNTRNNFIYPGNNSMFEIKYPHNDIVVQVL